MQFSDGDGCLVINVSCSTENAYTHIKTCIRNPRADEVITDEFKFLQVTQTLFFQL